MKITVLIFGLSLGWLSASPAQNTNPPTGALLPSGDRTNGGKPFRIDIVRLSPRVAVFYGDPWTNGVVAIASKKGIVVVDAPLSKTIARGFRDAIRQEFKRDDFACLINTHEDMCHVGGNEAYADLPIIGHEAARRKMLKWAANSKWATDWHKVGERDLVRTRERLFKTDPKQLEEPGFADYEKCWKLALADYDTNCVLVPPTITFDREMELFLGDITVRLTYYGCAHADADIIIQVPEENLVMTGGLFYAPHLPLLGRATEQATPQIVDNWFVVMHAVLQEADDQTRFVPSHDRSVLKKEPCAQQVAYLEKLWADLRSARADGKTLEQARADFPRQSFPEVANLSNEKNRGTPWERLDIHNQNIGILWKVLGK
jgi:glyoxylase-like metal-dependent hydrolase (beta-lactamase superfamily II)